MYTSDWSVNIHTVHDRTFGNFPAKNTVNTPHIYRVGQNCTSAPYATVCMVISLLEIPYVHRIYL
jgi:hypothetical protein